MAREWPSEQGRAQGHRHVGRRDEELVSVTNTAFGSELRDLLLKTRTTSWSPSRPRTAASRTTRSPSTRRIPHQALGPRRVRPHGTGRTQPGEPPRGRPDLHCPPSPRLRATVPATPRRPPTQCDLLPTQPSMPAPTWGACRVILQMSDRMPQKSASSAGPTTPDRAALRAEQRRLREAIRAKRSLLKGRAAFEKAEEAGAGSSPRCPGTRQPGLSGGVGHRGPRQTAEGTRPSRISCVRWTATSRTPRRRNCVFCESKFIDKRKFRSAHLSVKELNGNSARA
ncbi:hypothetical protein SVIOM342S_05013 [Streptomyces violaceorubidus]